MLSPISITLTMIHITLTVGTRAMVSASSLLFFANPLSAVYACILVSKHFHEASIERLYRQLDIAIFCADGGEGTVVVGVKPDKLVECMEASARVAVRARLAAKVNLVHVVSGRENVDGLRERLGFGPTVWPAMPYADLAKWISQHLSPIAFQSRSFGYDNDLSGQLFASLRVDRLRSVSYRSVLGGGAMEAFVALICRAASTLQSISLPGRDHAGFPGAVPSFTGFPGAVPSFPQLKDLTLSPDSAIPLDEVFRMIGQAPRLQRVLLVEERFLDSTGATATHRQFESLCRQRGIEVVWGNDEADGGDGTDGK